ncbi:MAG: hypothetical protein IJU50_05530, partial [Lachnospiraceae bacterium]|nr:hypothetical protein [Lachnospiraceae bacterium]
PYFIVGEDTFFMMEKWYRPEDIFLHSILAVALRTQKRNGIIETVSLETAEEKKSFLSRKYGAETILLPMEPYVCSSSEIRELIRGGNEAKEFLPGRVERYIKEKGLYAAGRMDL